ncbi:DUF2247 family protein [Pseudomonas sp. DTU_2021_1001937_2_SI_NGA_ILE_001]|uniref:DUF2247 family protein n=1 Tax=Pseudomonas sp. DTU_2021_1001937_2_SI_NGA_ILE_001 TaxID=3077589 RepID=UPI0028FC1586|nr:DUF2247 family protein [Pseudomonas sp. DTU_2021_1001937_2_SI_NGA_ILE_001]WNW12259.1 DUF2247 family protein [Pseudomonas sp. DTU_2021_1001937_2_SI_NGA_ILE_001]
MTPLKFLTESNLARWPTILVGFKKNWVTRENIFDYAMSQLSSDGEDEHTAVIAGGRHLSNDELIEEISKKITKYKEAIELDKWRLAFLIKIKESSDCEETKINNIQCVYADFNYPEDMSSCSIYAHNNIDPLLELNQVIENLKSRIQQSDCHQHSSP